MLKYLEINGFMAHPENILVAMLAHKEENKRERAAPIILNTRITERSDPYPTSRRKPRLFINPSLNMDADDYPEMVTIERPYARGYCYFTHRRYVATIVRLRVGQ